MDYKQLTKDCRIPVIGLGTWEIGGRTEADYSKDEAAVEAIMAAIKMGYTHIDTAESYGAGHCEELVGKAIKGIDRSRLFITTKVTKTNLRYGDVIKACTESLRRLGTSYVDLYLIHAPNAEIPIKETMRAMDELVSRKMVRFIGVSNFTVEQLKAAQQCTQNKIVANQIEYSLLTRNIGRYSGNHDMESKTIPYCRREGIIIITERPVERGLLAKHHQLLDRLAEKYHKTNSQIAINWLISKQNIVTIPKSTNPEHLKENLGAAGWKMDNEDIEELDKTDFGSLAQ
jgi:diketogulonate reductase-like aldo/keto reductase